MNGCWIPDTPIAVDYWRTRKCTAKFFFLSHMHADHTSGLSSSWKDIIYCSELTAKLLKAKFDIKDELIRPLETGMSHVVDLDVINSVTMTVTLIDAHHCPGAVMFLFEGYFGTILYTGDFRFCEAMLPDLDLLNGKTIDTLYFDNTYNSPEFLFPSREDAKKQLMQIIEDHKNLEIVLGMHSLGKEDLLVDIATRFRTWIVVSPEKMDLVKLLDLPDVFTTDINAGWIRVEKKMRVTNKNLAIWNKEQATIAILPTALHSSCQNYRNTTDIHVVPYSDHSSYRELLEFVAHVKPRRLIPIVKKGDSYSQSSIIDLQHFDVSLDISPQVRFFTPEVLIRNSSFISVSTNKTQKTVNNGLKRKHSLGVQFYDSPEKQHMPKQPRLDESHASEECATKATNEECNNLAKGINENNTVIIKVDETSRSLEVNGGKPEGSVPLHPVSVKTSSTMGNDSQCKNPKQHLFQLFAGQCALLGDEKSSVAQRKDVLHKDILHYFQRKETSLSGKPQENSCKIIPKSVMLQKTGTKHDLLKNDSLSTENNHSQGGKVISVKTVVSKATGQSGDSSDSLDTANLTCVSEPSCSPTNSSTTDENSYAAMITEPFCSLTNSLTTVENSCAVLKTESSCSPTNSSTAVENCYAAMVTEPSCSLTNSLTTVENSCSVLRTEPSCIPTNPSTTLELQLCDFPNLSKAEPSFDFKTCKKMSESLDHLSCSASESFSYPFSSDIITELIDSLPVPASFYDVSTVDAQHFKYPYMGVKPVHMMKTKEEKRRIFNEVYKMFC